MGILSDIMDMIEFTRSKDGLEKEYQKVLRRELDMIYANGRTKESLNERYNELHKYQGRYFEEMQNRMTEMSLTDRALSEISHNWNNKKYWGKDE